MRKILIIMLLLFVAQLHGQNRDSIYISQYVKNSFTMYGVSDALITIMDTTGNIIDTVRTTQASGSHEARAWSFTVPRKPSTFRIRAEHPNYETSETIVVMKHPARLNSFRFPDIMMKIKTKSDNVVKLGEARVKSTRVQLYYRGDTIVVDAKAFKLPEGSMLDALVKSVPGCEMKDNGDIYMNGKKVDYLTLNGKDFFKGNNKMMLENLPYYTVDKLQFYDQQSEHSYMLGKDVDNSDYVMNVKLKREYSLGYMANADIAGGTHDRWLARVFGLRFTDNSRIAFFGNANNVSENSNPSSRGKWSTTKAPFGDNKIYNLGSELSIDDKHGKFKETANATLIWQRNTDETRTTHESFLQQSTAYNIANQNSKLKTFSININNNLLLKQIGLKSDTRLRYDKRTATSWTRTGQFSASPTDFGNTLKILDSIFSSTISSQLLSILVNRTNDSSSSNTRGWNISQDFSYHKSLPWGDDLFLNTSGKWAETNTDELSDYMLYTPASPQENERQERDNRNTNRNYELRFGVSYSIHLFNQWHITLNEAYSQQGENIRSNLYRLDRGEDGSEVETLPSVIERARLQDWNNSWRSKNIYHANELSLILHSHKRDTERGRFTSFTATLPAYYSWATEEYSRGQRSTDASDHRWLFQPNIDLEHNTRSWRDTYAFNYNLMMRSPDLTQKVYFTDNSNPLAVLQGNPDLRPSHTHNLSLTFHTRFGTHSQFLMLRTNGAIMRNLVAQNVSYNQQSGVYTYKPTNVNGNWNWTTGLTYRRALTENRRLNIESNTNFDYYRNVDMKTDIESNFSERSIVDRYTTKESIKMEYRHAKWQAAISGSLELNNIRPHYDNSAYIDSKEYSYGITFNSELPWKFRLITDFKMYSRRGYSDKDLNTDYLLWNAQLERSLCKGTITMSLKAFDLLHQISQTHVTVNSQGRTETWQMALPNYVMLHLVYHWNKNPKKR